MLKKIFCIWESWACPSAISLMNSSSSNSISHLVSTSPSNLYKGWWCVWSYFPNQVQHRNHNHQSWCKRKNCILFPLFEMLKSILSYIWIYPLISDFFCHYELCTFYCLDYLWCSSWNLCKGCTSDKKGGSLFEAKFSSSQTSSFHLEQY